MKEPHQSLLPGLKFGDHFISISVVLGGISLLINNEIHEREKREDQVKILNEELEQKVLMLDALNKEMEAFNYSVSHDLRAPLRSIDGFSKIVLTRYSAQLDEQGQKYLQFICENSQRMGQLIVLART